MSLICKTARSNIAVMSRPRRNGLEILLLFAIIFLLKSDALCQSAIELKEINFDQAIGRHKYLFVNFYAPWCRYWKQFRPLWIKLPEILANEGLSVALAQVNIHNEQVLVNKYNIIGSPVFKLFIDGKPYDYSGPRKEDQIVNYLKRKLRQDLPMIINPQSAILSYLTDYEWIGIFFNDSSSDNKTIKDIAFEINDIYFTYMSREDASIFLEEEVGASTFILITNFYGDQETYKFNEKITFNSIIAFIETYRLPEVSYLTIRTVEQILYSKQPKPWLLLVKSKHSNQDDALLENIFEKSYSLVQETRNMYMTIAYIEDEITQNFLDLIHVLELKKPIMLILELEGERFKKYKFTDNIDTNSIIRFVNESNSGSIPQFFLSEARPSDTTDLVKKIVTDTFEEFVLDPEKDVLLLIWTPSCDYCRGIMNPYENIARKTRNVKDMIVAKIDASRNELEAFNIVVDEYPSILFFTRGRKADPIEFKGQGTEYDLHGFIKSHASVDLTNLKGPNPWDRNEL